MRPSQTFRRIVVTFPSQNTVSHPEDYNLIFKCVGYMQWRAEEGGFKLIANVKQLRT